MQRYYKMFAPTLAPYIKLAFISTFSILLIWAPFYFRIGPEKSEIRLKGFELVQRTYDGPLYAIAAKSLYRADVISGLKTFDAKYFAIHPPGYPMLIRIVAPVFGYLNGMLFVNFIGTIALAASIYYLIDNTLKIKEPLYLTTLILLTPRMLVSSAIGSSEIIFLFCINLSLILIYKQRYLMAGLFAMYASFTRVPGVILGISLFSYLFIRRNDFKANMRIIIPASFSILGFGLMCLFYQRQYGDFFAYFNSGAVVPTGIIYSQFFINARLVGDRYLEDILFYFGIAWITLLGRSKELPPLVSIFSWITFAFVITISHREMSRYILPLIPFLIAMQSEFLRKSYVKIGLVLLLPAIYLYSVNFIANYSYPLPIHLLK